MTRTLLQTSGGKKTSMSIAITRWFSGNKYVVYWWTHSSGSCRRSRITHENSYGYHLNTRFKPKHV